MAAEDDIRIRLLSAEDAEGLSRCFERCYGRSYVYDVFYDPAELRRRIADGRLRSVVAVEPGGEVVGHVGLTFRTRGATTVDAGNTVVDPRYRHRNLSGRLAAGVVALCQEEGLVGFHHYPTTAHPVVQKLAVQAGGTETGIMLDFVPGDTDYRGMGEGPHGRLAVTVVYQPIGAAPAREVFLPDRYAELLATLFERAGLRRVRREPGVPDTRGATQLEPHADPARGLLRIGVASVGDDLAEQVERAAEGVEAEIEQVDLLLADPRVSEAVETLRRLGYFYAAVLPEYDDGDVLRLQRIRGEIGRTPAADVATDEARDLLRFLLRDRDDAMRCERDA